MSSNPHGERDGHAGHARYASLAGMIAVSFVAMFALMYAMVDRWANVLGNVNQVYMAALMTGAMVIIEFAFMGAMYPKAGANRAILAGAVIVVIASWFGIREQWGVGDRQFLRSMIPHHAGAVLMCGKSPVGDPQIRALCEGIIRSQQEEIRQMQAMLEKD
jgi:uncharacterized protein (DUF305 family)